MSTPKPLIPASERGVALIVVVVVLVIVLVGGLAAVAVTSGELSGARGYRSRQTTRACAEAGLELARSNLPDETAAAAAASSLAGQANRTFSFGAGHYGDSTADNLAVLSAESYDAASLLSGRNVTNTLGSSGSGLEGFQIMSLTSTCSAAGYGEQEVQVIFRYGFGL